MGKNERFAILKKIADGGMAEVFVASQTGEEGFARTVILKRILPAFSASPQFRNMLVDEAHIAMTLHHSNIVPVMDLGQKDGTYFLVMELVDGWDLAATLARAEKAKLPLPRGLALYLTAQVCRGLAYAHTRVRPDGKPMGIVHRDISPQNVLISEQGEVRVTDFGIAKALGKRTRTESGVVKGNADFMSPEQASGAPLDATSDVFSVGAILYLLCTGQRPFTGPTELDALRKVQRGEYVPPEEANRKLSPAVAAIVKKAMQVRLSRRYRSAQEMLLEVEEVLRRDFGAAGQSELVQWLAELAKRDGELPASRRAGLPHEATQVLDANDIISVERVPAASEQTSAPEASADEPSIAPPPLSSEPHVPPRRRRVLVGMGFAVAGLAGLVITTRARRPAPPEGVTAKAPVGAAVPPGLAPEASPDASAPTTSNSTIPEVATRKPTPATRRKKAVRSRKVAAPSPAKPRIRPHKSR
jgi:eukaryotic-like serine/threonine-protein kinase